MTTMGQMQRSKFHQRDQKSCLLRTYSIFQAIDIVVMLDCLLSKTNSIFFPSSENSTTSTWENLQQMAVSQYRYVFVLFLLLTSLFWSLAWLVLLPCLWPLLIHHGTKKCHQNHAHFLHNGEKIISWRRGKELEMQIGPWSKMQMSNWIVLAWFLVARRKKARLLTEREAVTPITGAAREPRWCRDNKVLWCMPRQFIMP